MITLAHTQDALANFSQSEEHNVRVLTGYKLHRGIQGRWLGLARSNPCKDIE
jgi:hypothetical protein